MKVKITNHKGEEMTATFRISTSSTVEGERPNARKVEAWRCSTERRDVGGPGDLTLELVIEEHEVDRILGRLSKDAKHVATLSVSDDGAGSIKVVEDRLNIMRARAEAQTVDMKPARAPMQIERDACLRVVSMTEESALAFFGLRRTDVERVEDVGKVDHTKEHERKYSPDARHYRIFKKAGH